MNQVSEMHLMKQNIWKQTHWRQLLLTPRIRAFNEMRYLLVDNSIMHIHLTGTNASERNVLSKRAQYPLCFGFSEAVVCSCHSLTGIFSRLFVSPTAVFMEAESEYVPDSSEKTRCSAPGVNIVRTAQAMMY